MAVGKGTRVWFIELFACVLVVSMMPLGVPASASGPTPQIATFTFTGDLQSFTVPDGVVEIAVEASGASGGQASSPGPDPGGRGAHLVSPSVSVTPGEVLQIRVGGEGGSTSTIAAGSGGFNGGGAGGAGGSQSSGGLGGGGGGGATEIRREPYGTANRALIAAGGGGMGTYAARGGNGGASGTDGEPATKGGRSGGNGGAGGTGEIGPQTVGGSGSATSGGGGGQGDSLAGGGGGGGGGGAMGGGGGGGSQEFGFQSGSGGGGSSAGPLGTTIDDGANTGNGTLTITYSAVADTVAPTVTLTSPASTGFHPPSPTFAGAAGTAPTDDLTDVTIEIYTGTTVTGVPTQTIHADPDDTNGAYSTNSATLTDGTYTAQALQVDAAANQGKSAPLTFVVDAAAPETSIDSGPRARTRSTKATFTFSSDDPDATFECSLDKAAFSDCPSRTFRRLKRRKHTLLVRAVDHLDREDTSPAAYVWKSGVQHR